MRTENRDEVIVPQALARRYRGLAELLDLDIPLDN